MGLKAHMAYFTLEPSDIPTARTQTELTRFFAAPSARSAALYDGYYAVKPSILASLLCCFGASNPGSCQDPNSTQTENDDDDAADDDDAVGDVAVPRTGSSSSAC